MLVAVDGCIDGAVTSDRAGVTCRDVAGSVRIRLLRMDDTVRAQNFGRSAAGGNGAPGRSSPLGRSTPSARSSPALRPAPALVALTLNSGTAKAQGVIAGRRVVPDPGRRPHEARVADPRPAADDTGRRGAVADPG